jgi:hypothetical protein
LGQPSCTSPIFVNMAHSKGELQPSSLPHKRDGSQPAAGWILLQPQTDRDLKPHTTLRRPRPTPALRPPLPPREGKNGLIGWLES